MAWTTELAWLAVVVVAVGVSLTPQMRCWLGWHDGFGIQMRSGRRVGALSTVEWWCTRCGRTTGTTTHPVNLTTQVALRRQVPEARTRSKVIRFDVVRRDGAR